MQIHILFSTHSSIQIIFHSKMGWGGDPAAIVFPRSQIIPPILRTESTFKHNVCKDPYASPTFPYMVGMNSGPEERHLGDSMGISYIFSISISRYCHLEAVL